MKYFDLHCDTALELYLQKEPLKDGALHVSLKKADAFDTYIQTMAIWSDKYLSDEAAYLQFLKAALNLKGEMAENNVPLIKNASTLPQNRCGIILAVEDARILAGDLTRLDNLYRLGVRFLTLTWGGVTCIGGSHDTDAPLTAFGRAVVSACFKGGIFPDLSHASRAVTDEVLTMAETVGKPVIATHSNSYAVHPHTRNLTDAEFTRIRDVGGIVGISLCRPHLSNEPCGISAVIRHTQHFLSLGGEDTVCLGCDLDGIDTPPDGISSVADLPKLYEAMLAAGISEEIAEKIFFGNAYRFASAHL